MIKHNGDEKQLRKLAQVIWNNENHEEMLSWIFDCGLCSKLLDVIPKFGGWNKTAQIVLCSLWGNDRSFNMPICIPLDEYSYQFKDSICKGSNLKQYEHYFQDNPNVAVLLLPNDRNIAVLLERQPRKFPLSE